MIVCPECGEEFATYREDGKSQILRHTRQVVVKAASDMSAAALESGASEETRTRTCPGSHTPVGVLVTPEDMKIIVVGTNHGWGRGDTLDQARKNASQPKHYNAYVVHPKTSVDEISGSLFYPVDYPPKLIVSKLDKQATKPPKETPHGKNQKAR